METVALSSAPAASALVVAGPRLEQAESEAESVAGCYSTTTLLKGPQADTERVGQQLRQHDVVHVVAHGRFRHDNPMWSTIELSDGPLSVYEISRFGSVPRTVVLATCESAQSDARGGAQLHGMAGTLLRMGARTVVASVGALPDNEATRQTMVDLHHGLAAGQDASRILARLRAVHDEPLDATAATLVTLGVG